jgi:DNA mismatch endonuclease (patch repair protein)
VKPRLPGLERDAATSARLGRIRQSGTDAELRVRAALTAAGLRYRTSNRDLPGSPDIANRARGWAVFVHGCFWHRHEGCRRTTTPTRNRDFWVAKFEANVRRDARAVEALGALGYAVLVVWECEAEDDALLGERVRAFAASLPASVRPRPRSLPPRPRARSRGSAR